MQNTVQSRRLTQSVFRFIIRVIFYSMRNKLMCGAISILLIMRQINDILKMFQDRAKFVLIIVNVFLHLFKNNIHLHNYIFRVNICILKKIKILNDKKK